jgi:sodium transport system ATP-binding protein
MSIEVQQLVKNFPDRKKGKVEAVQDVSFSCRPGAIFGLLGLNGAGKTTILRTICTILQPVAGRVTVYGFDTTKQPDEVRRRIGFLPAGGGLYSHFTPRETLRYFGKLCKYPEDKIEQRVSEMISTLHMEDFADKYCKGLSSGMTQKVCLARAIVHDPPVVIFDEPTNSLDVLTRVAVHNLIRKCRDEGKCVILSTHIMSEAEKLCDDIAILHKGKILAAGTLEQLREQTGLHYLEDIFVRFVGEGSDEME